ncbi:MAG TPA: UDP-N-acetylmuramate dehydrogenase [Candidatus Polarisedimenticolaceae bacterium]|nr:UDP-N-acetylmuramate dehydrogenase [Candidatus Polarisedimenticolaceae bacterium]
MASPLAKALRTAGFRGEIQGEAPLGPLTTWRIGGPAEVLATPADLDDAAIALRFACERALPWHVLGNGSNLLVPDVGVRGLVLRLRGAQSACAVEGPVLTAGAGASFPRVANLAAEHGLAGLEFAAGIPGTVGGAVVMNAGWHEHETGNAVTSVEFLDEDGVKRTLDRAGCAFAYRTSAFRGRPVVIGGARFTLVPDDPAEVKARLTAFAESRKAHQPTELPSCGSVFLKPEGDFAGRLIEAAGLKGKRIGAIEVSPKHANFFVNLGGGNAKDVLALVEAVESEVMRKLGVRLVREFEAW